MERLAVHHVTGSLLKLYVIAMPRVGQGLQ